MWLSRSSVHAFAFVVACNALSAQGRGPALDVQDVVNQHWPASLPRPDGGTIQNNICQTVLARSGDEVTRIAAVYWYGDALLRILEREAPGRFRVAFESRLMMGGFCRIRLADVDRDGTADILLELAERKDGMTWVFLAAGTTFRDVTPIMRESRTSAVSGLLNAGTIDLDHAGPLEFAGAWHQEAADGRMRYWSEIFAYRVGRLVSDGEALVVTEFQRDDPIAVRKASFYLADDAPRRGYVLRLINGDRNGRGRASGLTVRINGERVAAEKLNDKVEFLDVPITAALGSENELYVEVAGAGDAFVTVLIRARTS